MTIPDSSETAHPFHFQFSSLLRHLGRTEAVAFARVAQSAGEAYGHFEAKMKHLRCIASQLPF